MASVIVQDPSIGKATEVTITELPSVGGTYYLTTYKDLGKVTAISGGTGTTVSKPPQLISSTPAKPDVVARGELAQELAKESAIEKERERLYTPRGEQLYSEVPPKSKEYYEERLYDVQKFPYYRPTSQVGEYAVSIPISGQPLTPSGFFYTGKLGEPRAKYGTQAFLDMYGRKDGKIKIAKADGMDLPVRATATGLTYEETQRRLERQKFLETPYKYKSFGLIETPIEIYPQSPAELGLPFLESYALGGVGGFTLAHLPRVAQVGATVIGSGVLLGTTYVGVKEKGAMEFFSDPRVFVGIPSAISGAYAGTKIAMATGGISGILKGAPTIKAQPKIIGLKEVGKDTVRATVQYTYKYKPLGSIRTKTYIDRIQVMLTGAKLKTPAVKIGKFYKGGKLIDYPLTQTGRVNVAVVGGTRQVYYKQLGALGGKTIMKVQPIKPSAMDIATVKDITYSFFKETPAGKLPITRQAGYFTFEPAGSKIPLSYKGKDVGTIIAKEPTGVLLGKYEGISIGKPEHQITAMISGARLTIKQPSPVNVEIISKGLVGTVKPFPKITPRQAYIPKGQFRYVTPPVQPKGEGTIYLGYGRIAPNLGAIKAPSTPSTIQMFKTSTKGFTSTVKAIIGGIPLFKPPQARTITSVGTIAITDTKTKALTTTKSVDKTLSRDIPKPIYIQTTKETEKDINRIFTGTVQIPSMSQSTKVIEALAEIPRTTQKDKPIFEPVITAPPEPIIPVPPIPGLILPFFRAGVGKRDIIFGKGIKSEYKPSFGAVLLDVYGKKLKTVTGLEAFRPIVRKRSKNKRKRR